MVLAYCSMFLISILLLLSYLFLIKHKEKWLIGVFVCVVVTNLGYFLCVISKTPGFAIFANDLTYLGSIYLQFFLLVNIINLCGFKIKKEVIIAGISFSTLMALLVLTSGILPWYYRSVSLNFDLGYTKIIKDYGPLRPIYYVYLLIYYVSMTYTIIYAIIKRNKAIIKSSALLFTIALGNLIMWLVQKFCHLQFEILSFTYILSASIIFMLYWMMEDIIHKDDIKTVEKTVVKIIENDKSKKLDDFINNDTLLTNKEKEVLKYLIEGLSRQLMAEKLYTSVNTIKTHVSHIYQKLNVSSKDELIKLIYENEKTQ